MRVGAVDIDVDARTELVVWFHLHIHTPTALGWREPRSCT